MNEDKPNADSNNDAEGQHHDESVTDSTVPNQSEEAGQENNAAGQNNDEQVNNAGQNNEAEPAENSGNVVANTLRRTIEDATTLAHRYPTAAIVGGIAIGAIAGVAAAPYVIASVGFGSSGVLGGSIAAAVQSSIGNVAAGSVFATLQSVGATGVLTSGVAATAAVTGGVAVGTVAAGGVYAANLGNNESADNQQDDGSIEKNIPEATVDAGDAHAANLDNNESADNQQEQNSGNGSSENAPEATVEMAEAVLIAEDAAQEFTADNAQPLV